MVYDVLIIGAGVVGCAIAREMSRYHLKVLVVEQGADVASGTSKANSGIIHAGYDAPAKTLMARLNVVGADMMAALCHELCVPYKQTGSLVVADGSDADRAELLRLAQQGAANGVPNLHILQAAELRRLVPLLNTELKIGLYAPTAAVIAPYELTIALAENAAQNGVKFLIDRRVTGVIDGQDFLTVLCGEQRLHARLVVNAAGVYADQIAGMVGDSSFKIVPFKGQELILDKQYDNMTKLVIFPLPSLISKGIVVAPTPAGNLLIGPTAEPACERTDTTTTRLGQRQVFEAARRLIPALDSRGIITSYAGLRAVADTNDFVIRYSEQCPRLLHVAGIKSPGLSAAPAIAKMVRNLIGARMTLKLDPAFDPMRRLPPSPKDLPLSERHKLIERDPAYGRVICRCEQISEGEIRDALQGQLRPITVDGLKRRLRVGMGRCQGGFCLPHLISLVAEYCGLDPADVTKQGVGSEYITGKVKAGLTGGEGNA